MLGGVPGRVLFILLVELCERYCFYNIQGSQKFFLSQRLGYGQAQSTTITTLFNTACYLTCLLGGVLADRFWGRYLTIAALSSVYVLGTFAMAFATDPSINSKSLFFLGTFAGIALGTGGIKPNVSNFGADQVPNTGQGADKARERYFVYFYLVINIGAAVGLGIMPTLATSPETFGIKQDYGYFVSYLCAAIGMAACLGVFLAGSCTYVNKFLTARRKIYGAVWSAFVYSARRSFRGKVCLLGWLLLVPFFVLSFLQAFAEEGSAQAEDLAWLAFGIAMVQLACLTWAHCDNSFLQANPARQVLSDGADPEGDASITDIRLTFQTIPILLVANTVFNFAYTMMIGPFLSESCQMNLKLGSGQLNAATFNLGDTFAIIAFTPLLDWFVYPAVERRLGRAVSVKEKLFGGFFWAALAMVSASALELLRRSSPVLAPPGWSPSASPEQRFPDMPFSGSDYQHYESFMGQCIVNGIDYCSNCAPMQGYPYCDAASCPQPRYNAGIYMSSISSWWMFVPFSCIGLGEIMVNPVLYYYAYSLTPEKSRSVIQAVNLVFQGAYPAALVGVFSTVLASQQPNNLNRGHIEIFYYISLVIIFVGSPVLLLVTRACVLLAPGEAPADPNVVTNTSTVNSFRMQQGQSFVMSAPEAPVSPGTARL